MFENKLEKSIFAFSLIELSMVMIVIGLIISTVVGGQKIVEFSRLSKARQLTNNASFVQKKSLVLWLEPTFKNSFKNIDDEDIYINNEDAVEQWVNLVDSDINPVQGTEVNQPTFISKGINYIPTIRFDGNDYLRFENNSIVSLNPNKFTIFIVASVSSDAALAKYLFNSLDSGNGYSLYLSATNTFVTGISGSSSDESGALTLNQASIFIADYDGTTLSTYLNNSSVYSSSKSFSRNTTFAPFIGAKDASNNYFTGDISEIIIFKKVLSDNERGEIYDYLAEKYKIN